MIGLALEGGGIRGSYEAGVYKAFLDCHVKIDGVCGTSIGALNGALIASGDGEKLIQIWRSTDFGKLFGFSDSLIKALNSKEFNLEKIKGTFEGVVKLLKNKGIDLKGVREVLDKNLDIDKLLNSKIDFGLCTVRARDLKPLYLFKKDMVKNKVKDYIIASSFLPIFKREKLIDDNYYLDGGFYDLGPVNMLLNKGYSKVYLVKVRGIGLHRPYDKDNVVVIEPKRSLGKVIEIDPKRIDENIKMGYYDALKILKNLDGDNYVFKNKKESFYKFLNRKVDKNLYERVAAFFKTKTMKETTIKALEHIMEEVGVSYYKIYDIRKMIKYIKRNYQKDNFMYKYIEKLKYLL